MVKDTYKKILIFISKCFNKYEKRSKRICLAWPYIF